MMFFKTGLAALAIAASTLFAGSASAATINLLGTSDQNVGNTAGVSYAQGYGAFTPNGATASNLLVDTYKSPFTGTAVLGTSSFFAAERDEPDANFAFDVARSTFTILWGSIDSYNILSFDNGESFTGTDIINEFMLGGTAPRFEQVALVQFVFDTPFSEVNFFSDGANAFEFAMAAVPLPAGGLLLLAALGGVGVASRRNKAA